MVMSWAQARKAVSANTRNAMSDSVAEARPWSIEIDSGFLAIGDNS